MKPLIHQLPQTHLLQAQQAKVQTDQAQQKPTAEQAQAHAHGSVDARTGANSKQARQTRSSDRPMSARMQRNRGGASAEGAQEKKKIQLKNDQTLDNEDHDDGDAEELPHYFDAKHNFKDLLQDPSEKGQQAIKEGLKKSHSPFDGFSIAFNMKIEARKNTHDPDAEKAGLAKFFDAAMKELASASLSKFRGAFTGGGKTSPVAATAQADQKARMASGQGREMRTRFNADIKNSIDELITSTQLCKTVLANFGKAYAEEALNQVASVLTAPLRSYNAQRSASYQLALSDAAAVACVRTGFKLGQEIKRLVTEKTNTPPEMHHTEIGALLLDAAALGWGRGKGLQLTNQIQNVSMAEPLVRAALCAIVRDQIQAMPPTAWPPDRANARRDLLDDLRQEIINAFGEIAPQTSFDERMEDVIRKQAASQKPAVSPSAAPVPSTAPPSYEQAMEQAPPAEAPPSYTEAMQDAPPTYMEATLRSRFAATSARPTNSAANANVGSEKPALTPPPAPSTLPQSAAAA